MTNKQVEAMKLALEWIGDPHNRKVSAGKMVAILTEALAEQPRAQSPDGEGTLAPAPVSETHKPLTDEQAVKIIQGAIHNLSLTCDGPISAETVGMWVLRAFEAKLKEKNNG